MGPLAVVLCFALLAYALTGWALVDMAHWRDPSLRRASQLAQFLAVVAWPAALWARRRDERRHRNRLRG